MRDLDNETRHGDAEFRQQGRCQSVRPLQHANAGWAMHQQFPIRMIEQPHLPRARPQVVANLAPDVHRAFRRRQDFEGNIWGDRRGNHVEVDLAGDRLTPKRPKSLKSKEICASLTEKTRPFRICRAC